MELYISRNLPVKPYEKKWQFCVGSCHAATLLRTDTLKILKRLHDELGIQRVRCHGVFNDDMGTVQNFPKVFGLPVGEQIVETNFYKVGLLYDNILSLGMKPFVELSFMPQLLAKDPKRFFMYGSASLGSVTSMPRDLDEWQKYIRAYLTYLFHRYGEEEVVTWYFEVWNEPDLSSIFFQGGENEYLTLYTATARTIKDFCPRLKVGGPASSASRWVDLLVHYCRENDVPLDFVSTHQYIGDPFPFAEKKSTRSASEIEAEKAAELEKKKERIAALKQSFDTLPPDMSFVTAIQKLFGGVDFTENDFDRDIFPKNAAVVRQQAEGLPLFYTEWNLSSNFASPNLDMRKVAAYDVRTSLAIEDLVEGDSIWCASDLFEELHQFKEPFHGGYGIMNLNGIPKPVFYGMRMLAQAGDKRIQFDPVILGETEAAAFESEHEKQILLYRFSTRQTDAPKEAVTVQVELNHAPKRVWLQRIDEDHCNPRRVWEEMGAPNDLNAEEVNRIIERSAMQDENLPYTFENGVLAARVSIGINDVYFIRIEK